MFMLERMTDGNTEPSSGPASGAVVVAGLTKRFGSRTVVDSISFAVPRGSVAGLIGPNGAGKTTIMGMLLGLVRPTAGEAWILGSPVADRAAYLPRVGSLIEGPAFHPGVSGIDNLRSLAILGGLATDGIDGLIDTVGLTGRGGDPVGSYSLGMKQRLGIAAALLGDPELVVLDEPTNGLDPVGMQDVRELIGEIARGGKTVIVSSHLLAELEVVCDWLIVVDRGGLVHAGPASALGAAGSVLVLGAAGDRLDDLIDVVERLGHELAPGDVAGGALRVIVPSGDDPSTLAAELNAAAHAAGIVLHELHHDRADLEARYLQLVDSGGVK
jgi:ABC-2 type transport system ATP-binding protein